MKNLLKISEHDTYGKMRHIFKNGEVLFSGTDVIHALGFTNKAILTDCVDEQDRVTINISESVGDTNRTVGEIMINLFGVQSLIAACKNKVDTKVFKSWLINGISSKYCLQNSGSIYTTKDYSMFKYLEGNRDTLQARVDKIKNSINKVGYVTNPIIVNDKFEVVDGQGRVEALKQMNLPVDYIVVNGVGTEECISLNIYNTSWNLPDYVKSYAERGNDNYKRLYNLFKEYKDIGIRNITAAVSEKNIANSTVKDGTFILSQSDYEKGKKVLDYLNKFIPCIKKKKRVKKQAIIPALIFCYFSNDIDNDKLFERFNDRFPLSDSPDNIAEGLMVIEDIYNKNSRNKVMLSYIFNMSKNKVNPNKK